MSFDENDNLTIYYPQGLLLLDYLFPNLHHALSLAGKKSMYDRFYDDDCLYDCI